MSGINAKEDIRDRKLITETIKLKIAEFIELVEDKSRMFDHGSLSTSIKQNPVPQEVINVAPEKLITADEFNLAVRRLANIFINFRRYHLTYDTYRSGDNAHISRTVYTTGNNASNNFSNSVTDGATLTPITVASGSMLTDQKVTEVLDNLYRQWLNLPVITNTVNNWVCHCNCNCHHSSGGWK